jgi:1-acyl-sn-glycerol-3-phosphate acyltransferase
VTLLERIFAPRWFMPTAIVLVRTYLKVFTGLHVQGLENVPRTGSAVVACNHLSSWDPPVVGVAINRKLEFMAKKELFEKPFVAAVLRGLRAFPVDRQRNDIGAIKEALRRLKAGRVIGIFIQGTRNDGDAAALDGAAYLAQRAGAVVVPTAIWRQGRAFHVRFGEVITASGSDREDMKLLTSRLALEIKALVPDNV